jgi:peptidoglycan-associated lipoprotein
MIGVGLLLSGGCAPEYPNCRSDEDCQRVNPREVCVDGQCRQCRDDSQCDRGQQCDDNSCVGIPGWCEEARDCSDGQICIDNRCLPCESDDQCQTGYGQNYWCDGGSCVDSCRSDADCPAGQRCVAGECVSEEEQIANCALDPVYFDFDSSTIRSDMRDVLQANAQCIRDRSISSVSLEGNCDPRGTTEYNYALGERRASAVKRVIVGHGVPGRSLRTVSYGEDRASGTGEDSWARDRRVDFSQ